MSHDEHLYGRGTLTNMLAAIQPPKPAATSAPVVAPKPKPSAAPQPVRQPAPKNHEAGYSQAPMMGDKQKIPKPPTNKIAADPKPVRESADRTSGITRSLADLADKMHPVKRR